MSWYFDLKCFVTNISLFTKAHYELIWMSKSHSYDESRGFLGAFQSRVP